MIDMKTDFVPEVITDTIPHTLSELGDAIDTIPDTLADGVTTTVSRTRRLLRSAPWTSDSRMIRRRWLLFAAVIGVIAALAAVWFVRRSDDRAAPAENDADPLIVPSPTRRVA